MRRPARGDRLGPFEIASLLGAGGMGEVYRARDTHLQRDVAIKILPEGFAADPDRVARFKREAHVLAALNHPNIAAIYGFEESADVQALVLELVEGPTLADRIANGPVPVDEALSLAKQLADALDTAHRQGIVHRDLKPANLKVRPDGTLKVLDFGLAKAMEAPTVAALASQSPTFSAAATGAGVLLGTAGYMSPEQARGEVVDHQADVWGFGCVLFEMLTGRRAFEGRTASDAIAAVLRGEPEWSALPPALHPRLRLLLERCLEKDTVNRYHSIADARVDIARAQAAPVAEPVSTGATPARASARWPVAVAAVVLPVVAAIAGWTLKPVPANRVARFAHVLPQDQAAGTSHGEIAISRDGGTIVYVASQALHLRSLDDLADHPIAGTEGLPVSPFFSPDGQSVGYHDFKAGQLRRVPAAGGTPVNLASVTNLYGATWNDDGTILFGQEDGVWRMPAAGGAPEKLLAIQPEERIHGPRWLPDGRTLLFTLRTSVGSVGWDNAKLVAQVPGSSERRVIADGRDGRYLPTGHLVYGVRSVLMAVPFDPASLQMQGASVAMVEGVRQPSRFPGTVGTANYDISDNGTLVYMSGERQADQSRQLVSVDRRGIATPIVSETRDYWRPRVSPDGTRIAVEVAEGDQEQLWIVDRREGVLSALTTDGPGNVFTTWTPDGRALIHRSNRSAGFGIYRTPVDGRGGATLLYPSPVDVMPGDTSRDGVLVFAIGEQTGRRAIFTLPLAGGAPTAFLDTPAMEHMPVFSPDGAWVAYASTESGRSEVYVRAYPAADGIPRRISRDGGTAPVWARDGTELFYRNASGTLVAVSMRLNAGATPGRSQELFQVAGRYRTSGNAPAYDVDASGHFIMVTMPNERPAESRQLGIVLNWQEELARLAPMR